MPLAPVMHAAVRVGLILCLVKIKDAAVLDSIHLLLISSAKEPVTKLAIAYPRKTQVAAFMVFLWHDCSL